MKLTEIKLSDLKAFKVGNAENPEAATGCTAIICEKGAFAGVDVRGGAPASRETPLLNPVNAVQQIHCVMLSGGSAYGLSSADGVMRFLDEKNIGFDTGFGIVPIVCGASLFDLELVTNRVRPDREMGYEACKNAFEGKPVLEGNHGAGTGATVGKWFGAERMMKSGLGIYAAQLGSVQVAALVAVNALGDIYDYDDRGKILAGLLNEDKTGFADSYSEMYKVIGQTRDLWGGGNTTIGCVITNAKLDKCQCNKLASIGHNGFAQSIRPVHTSADGDTLFVMATGEVEVQPDALGAMVTEVVARAINRAATQTEPAYGLKSYQSFR
ncbi:MAG: P1 family peptidase [Lachnospiraceae bacterium]|nr:P1 family peptidase [Lachnospiraceae bacterium]